MIKFLPIVNLILSIIVVYFGIDIINYLLKFLSEEVRYKELIIKFNTYLKRITIIAVLMIIIYIIEAIYG